MPSRAFSRTRRKGRCILSVTFTVFPSGWKLPSKSAERSSSTRARTEKRSRWRTTITSGSSRRGSPASESLGRLGRPRQVEQLSDIPLPAHDHETVSGLQRLAAWGRDELLRIVERSALERQ